MSMKYVVPCPKEMYWPCACVKRDRAGNLSKIKMHHPQQLKCSRCKCQRPEDWPQKFADWFNNAKVQ